MPKAFRHIEGTVIGLGQLDGDVVEVGRALRAQVDDDVQNRTTRAAHEFCLGCGWILKVHAAQCAFLVVKSDICLHNYGLEPVRLELLLTESPCKEASIIFFAINVNDICTFEFGFSKNHPICTS
jgi:hypothetical protein